MSSPGRAPARVNPISAGRSPIAVIVIAAGDRTSPTSGVFVVSPPNKGQPASCASAIMPRINPANHVSSRSGSPIARKNARGTAPAAAKSDRLTASAL